MCKLLVGGHINAKRCNEAKLSLLNSYLHYWIDGPPYSVTSGMVFMVFVTLSRGDLYLRK